MQRYKGELALFIGTILAAAGWFFSKFAIAELPPLAFVAIRFLTAGLIFLPFAVGSLRQLSLKQFTMAGVIGLFFALNLMTWIFAIHHAQHLGEGAFIMSLSMLIAPLVSWLVFQNRPNRLFGLALPTAVGGLYLLMAGQGGLHFSADNQLFLLSAAALAIYFVLLNQFAKQIAPLALTTIMLLVVGVICTLYSAFTESWQFQLSAQTWGWLAASILIATNLRFLIQTIGQRYCNIGNSAIIMLLEPVWTLAFSLAFFHESLTWQKALGCVLILSSLFIYRLPMIVRRK